MEDAPVLIAGAGPTGLAAALLLAKAGVKSRIVDPRSEPSQTSKALAVNPRSLKLLEGTGVTERILAEGRRVHHMQLRKGAKVLAEIRVDDVDPTYPIVVLPQADTEALLAEALAAHGVVAERELAVETVVNVEGGVEVGLRRAGGPLETTRASILFGADGAHSVVRHALGIDFPGDALEEPWNLVDVEFERPVEESEGYIEFLPHHRLVFALAFTPTRWRVIVAGEDPMDHLPPGAVARTVIWKSAFKISHRIAEMLNLGRVCLGGDAAHLHSPMGARGMNLGVEDAYVFAHLAKQALDQGSTAPLQTYGRLRHEADAGVVRRVKLGSETALGLGPLGGLRGLLPLFVPHLPIARLGLTRLVGGLDHPVLLS